MRQQQLLHTMMLGAYQSPPDLDGFFVRTTRRSGKSHQQQTVKATRGSIHKVHSSDCVQYTTSSSQSTLRHGCWESPAFVTAARLCIRDEGRSAAAVDFRELCSPQGPYGGAQSCPVLGATAHKYGSRAGSHQA